MPSTLTLSPCFVERSGKKETDLRSDRSSSTSIPSGSIAMASQAWPEPGDLERFREYLRGLARAHLHPQIQQKVDPSDVVQETLIKADRSLDQFRGQGAEQLAAWLREILANQIMDTIRKFRRGKRDVALERSMQAAMDESSHRIERWLAADFSTPSGHVLRQERICQLADAMADLPEDQRRAVELRHLRECSLAEIAREMDRTTASVAGLIRRGLVALRRRLETGGES